VSVVLDASAALALALPDEYSDWAQGCLAEALRTPARAPTLWQYEVASGLRNAERRGRIAPRDVDLTLDALLRLPVRFEQPRWLPAMLLSRELDVSMYDATYIEVAQHLGLPMVTADRRLATAAAAAGLTVIEPEEPTGTPKRHDTSTE